MWQYLMCAIRCHGWHRIYFDQISRHYRITCRCGKSDHHVPKIVLMGCKSFGQFPKGQEPIE
jgi:hypothetical protein